MQEPWNEVGKWRVSPANFHPEVQAGYNFPTKFEILDTTLRDGEQQPGLFISPEDRLRLVKQLDSIGIQRIEAGNPSISKQDADSVKAICALGLKARVYVFCRAMAADAELAKWCGVDGVLMEIPASEHLLKYGKKWSVDRAIKAAVDGTLAAKELGLSVSFFPADSSRMDIEALLDMVDQVKTDGYMDSLVLVDTFGCYTPPAAAYTVKRLKQRFPDLPVEAHFHEDFDMGVANTIAAFSAGADVAHTTVNGVGERAGSVPYEPLVLSLKLLYGQDTGIDVSRLVETSKMFRQMVKQDVHPHKAVVGDRIFTYETGLPWSLWKNCRDENPTAMFSCMWQVTGHSGPAIVLGKKSGKDNVADYLNQLGLTADADQAAKILERIKNKAYELKRALQKEEFIQIHKEVTSS